MRAAALFLAFALSGCTTGERLVSVVDVGIVHEISYQPGPWNSMSMTRVVTDSGTFMVNLPHSYRLGRHAELRTFDGGFDGRRQFLFVQGEAYLWRVYE